MTDQMTFTLGVLAILVGLLLLMSLAIVAVIRWAERREWWWR